MAAVVTSMTEYLDRRDQRAEHHSGQYNERAPERVGHGSVLKAARDHDYPVRVVCRVNGNILGNLSQRPADDCSASRLSVAYDALAGAEADLVSVDSRVSKSLHRLFPVARPILQRGEWKCPSTMSGTATEHSLENFGDIER